MAKRKNVEAVRAFAWEFNDPPVLCCWAEPDIERLVEKSEPSPEAKPVSVRIIRERDYLIRERDYRALLRAARTKGKP